MKVLVIGRSGQVAQALAERPGGGVVITAIGRPEADLTDRVALEVAIEQAAPDIVVNAAAYTAVDKAESDEAAAFAVNADGPQALGAAARKAGVPVIHLSTDYVFDGRKAAPYVEDDDTTPLGVYGRSKLVGEEGLASEQPEHIILRTAWVYAPYGANFVRTMLRLAETRPTVRVVADQVGCPTYAPHLADAILDLASLVLARRAGWGIYHAAGGGETSWHGLAAAVFAEGDRYGWPVPELEAITTADYPTPARRPANSRLDGSKLQRDFGIVLPHWQHGVADCVRRLAELTGRYPAPAEMD